MLLIIIIIIHAKIQCYIIDGSRTNVGTQRLC